MAVAQGLQTSVSTGLDITCFSTGYRVGQQEGYTTSAAHPAPSTAQKLVAPYAASVPESA
eukprot:3877001-Rhodomonas_salina.1